MSPSKLIDPYGDTSQAFRGLRISVDTASRGDGSATLLFTSAGTHEGATTVATNHALVAAAAGRNVLVIDANLQNPEAHIRFGAPLAPGLVDVVVGDRRYEECARTIELESVRLDLLPAGALVRGAGDLLASQEMADLIDSAAASYDLVVIDAAPVLKFPDAGALSALPHVDTVLVARRGQRRQRLQRAIAQLQRSEAKLLGVVLNSG